MEIVKDFKEILLTIIAFITVAGTFIDVFSKLLEETIKIRYKDVAIKQSRFEVTLIMGVYCTTALSLIISIYEIINVFISKTNNNEILLTWSWLFGLVFVFLWIFAEWAFIMLFLKIRDYFLKYLDVKADNIGTNISEKKYIFKLNMIIIVSSIYVAVWILFSAIYGIECFKVFGLFGITGVITIIVALSLKNIVILMINEKTSILYTMENKIIYCKYYLEYDEYYLVFSSYETVYINKNNIYKKTLMKNRK